MSANPYQVLGLSDSASPVEVKRAYRRKARCSHPDAVGAGHEAEFRQVQEAYDALKGSSSAASEDVPSSIRTTPAGPSADSVRAWPHDAHLELELDPREARHGLAFSFPLELDARCPACGGSGLFSLLCAACGGWGRLRQRVLMRVEVPPGVHDGDVVVGRAGTGSGAIDVGLTVRIAGRRARTAERFGAF